NDLALIEHAIADEALHERTLARPVLAEQGMHGAGAHLQRHVVERGEQAEALGRPHHFHAHGPRPIHHDRLPSVASSAFESDTVPNTPPCISTMLSAASWLRRSVAPQQSSSSV